MVMGVLKPGVTDSVDPGNDRFVDWLYGLVDEVREDCGLSERQSYKVVSIIVEQVQKEYGGQRPYVNAPSNRERVWALWAAGHDMTSIAKQLDISEAWVRRILKKQTNLPSSSASPVESCQS